MRSATKFAVLTLALTSLTACPKRASMDGTVPAQYLDLARTLVGVYSGTVYLRATDPFEAGPAHDATLRIDLDGNRPVLTISPDVLAPGCETRVGKLTSVEFDEKKNELIHAWFQIDPNRCARRVSGREVQLTFRKRNHEVVGIETFVHKDYVHRPERPGSPSPTMPREYVGKFRR